METGDYLGSELETEDHRGFFLRAGPQVDSPLVCMNDSRFSDSDCRLWDTMLAMKKSGSWVHSVEYVGVAFFDVGALYAAPGMKNLV